MKTIKIAVCFFLILMVSCQNRKSDNNLPIVKISDTDVFKNTMVKSQFFTISSSNDNTLESKKGSILVIPKGAFLDKNGNEIKDSIQIEYAEATDLDEMILSNLLIQDSKKIIETKLSFYINASRNGEQLKVNPQNPVYIELSSDRKINLYKTIRDKSGNMSLDELIEPIIYLTPVHLETLDFYPSGFEDEVEKGLPFRNHKTLTKELVDSLYYSFAWNKYGMENVKIVPTIPEVKHISRIDSIDQNTARFVPDTAYIVSCGINPASIKAIRNKKFQNTLISTKEFEIRLQSIFATCDDKILELYVNNLDKNLWEIDQMAADELGSDHKLYSKFIEFASFKQTKVELSDNRAKLLAKYYQKQKEKIEKDIQKLRDEFIAKKQKHEEIVQQKKEEYSALLEKRLEYRMNKFGFKLTEVGWYNAAHVITLEDLEKFELNVSVDNGDKYDRVCIYVINPKIKSIFSLLSDDKVHFDRVFSEDPHLLLWENQKFTILAVGYKGDRVAYKIEEHEQKPVVNVNMQLQISDLASFKHDLKEYTSFYTKENKINIDLEYQEFFYKERKKKEKEMYEDIFMYKLRKIVYPCCESRYYNPINFYNTKLKDVFSILSDIYDVSLISEDEDLNDLRITSSFIGMDINQIVTIICELGRFRYNYENGTYEFYNLPNGRN